MLRIKNNPTRKGLSILIPDISYSKETGIFHTLDMLQPQIADGDTTSRFPLIVFIQGSGWHFPNTYYELPQLARFAAAGFVVASVRHRNIAEGHPAPAYLKDVKTAVRFLRANADQYLIDPTRVYAFGTSSGGNTALLLGLTGDDPRYKTEEYPNVSDAVSAVIDCFGPADLPGFLENIDLQAGGLTVELFTEFCGGTLDMDLLKELSPLYQVQNGKDYVPFLIAHGDCDKLVDYSQSANLVQRLEEVGADVSFLHVEGADHEGDFWSEQIWEIFLEFKKKQAF